jgi:hypothetical protein
MTKRTTLKCIFYPIVLAIFQFILVYPSCVGVLTAIAYFSIVYCFTCMKTHIASEIESGEVVYKEKYRHLMIIRGPRYVHQSPCFQPCQIEG